MNGLEVLWGGKSKKKGGCLFALPMAVFLGVKSLCSRR